MPLLSLGYRRPAYVEKSGLRRASDVSTLTSSTASVDGKEKGDVSTRPTLSRSSSNGIPSALSFDKIIEGGTCPPCTVRDFMNYLIYVERSAENLQFFLWYRGYVKRFNAAPTSDLSLAPEWTQAMDDEAHSRLQKEHMEKLRKEPEAAQIFKDTDFEKQHMGMPDPFGTPPPTPGDESVCTGLGSNALTYRSQASDAFNQAGAKQPFTIQPFREEIDRVIATYIMDKSPRQLNLSSREQKAVIHALAYTTHPTAFRSIAKSIEASLRLQAHPNFIRWSICNGNPARVFFARALGVSLIVIAFAVAIILTLSRAGRGWRALAAIGWVLGISTLVAAYKGMCVVLHGMHHRHIRPWELFEVDDASLAKTSFESFDSSNSYEEEPWMVKYQKRNIIRKIFDREIWIQEPALRQIQDTIFVQAMLSALLLSGILTAIFVVVPGGHFY